MDGARPLELIRDFTVWPVQPVIPVPPTRPVRDLEPFSPETEIVAGGSPAGDTVSLSASARPTLIEEVMRTDVITIESHEPVAALVRLLLAHQISGVPVLEAGTGTLVGVVSQADVLRGGGLGKGCPSAFSQNLLLDPVSLSLDTDISQMAVSEIMTPYVYYATEDSTLIDVLDVMLRHHLHRVVITRDRRLAGVVTSIDLLRHYRTELQS